MKLIDDPVRRLIRERVENLSEMSRAIGKNPTYLQQFINRGHPAELSERTRRLLAAKMGIPESQLRTDQSPGAILLSSPNREGLMAEGVQVDVADLDDELRRPLLAAMQGRHAEVWRIESAALAGARYHPGDYVVVDLAAAARARDIVLADHRQTPVFRLYLPPYLYAAAIGEQPLPLTVDNVETFVRGVVVSRHSSS